MTRLVTTNGHPVVNAPAADDHSLGSTLATAATSGNRTVTSGSHVRSYAPIEQSEWVLVTEAAREGPVIAVLGRSVVAMVAAVVVTLLVVGVILGRQTVVPLVKLRRVIERMEEGDLDVDLRTDREDEIGRLYEAFGQMSTALREQVREAKEVRREAERSKQELERQNDRLDQFASTLSHDLRNPLAVARGHVELLATTIDSDEYPDMEEHVAKIDDAHDRIDDIIGDVLTLTRKGESVEEIERFQLESTAREAWGNIDSKDATMVVEESRVIEGDRTRLLRAFENLFRNSLDHGSDDVTVTVGLTKNGFYVQDDGPGIPDDELEHIFDYGHTTSEDGTGLGLSIVKTIVEAHGWSIWIDVTYGDGARFVFTDVFENESEPFAETEFTWAETLRQQ
jgi:signal transduction histidine kinase